MPLKDPEARRVYHRKYMQARLASDPEFKKKHLDRVRRNDVRVREAVQALINDFRKDGCQLCPEKEPCCLSAHHVDGTTKEFSLGQAKRMKLSPETVTIELEKCICLCENCHRKVHAGVLKLESSGTP